MLRRSLVVCVGTLVAAFTAAQQPAPADPAALYEGALFIPGDGRAPIEDSAFLIRDGAIASVGKRGEIAPPPGRAPLTSGTAPRVGAGDGDRSDARVVR